MAGRILIVDDEKAILVALRGLFTKEGYEVDTGRLGRRRRSRRSRPDRFHVVVTDLSMDGITGMQVLERAAARSGPGRRDDHAHGLGEGGGAGDEARATTICRSRSTTTSCASSSGARWKAALSEARPPPPARAGAGRVRLRADVGRRRHAELFETIDRVADTDVTVSIRGESGTARSWSPTRSTTAARAAPSPSSR
jgi:CheY-like chemotaxis protein